MIIKMVTYCDFVLSVFHDPVHHFITLKVKVWHFLLNRVMGEKWKHLKTFFPMYSPGHSNFTDLFSLA